MSQPSWLTIDRPDWVSRWPAAFRKPAPTPQHGVAMATRAGQPQRVWNTGAGWYTGVGIPASRAFNCRDRNWE
jgi:hypothetical protein